MLLEENHELLLKLHIVDDKIIVIGDPQYFPKLAETKGQMELCECGSSPENACRSVWAPASSPSAAAAISSCWQRAGVCAGFATRRRVFDAPPLLAGCS